MRPNTLILIVFVCQILVSKSYAQPHYLTNHFAQEHGLPSNHIYDICEDVDGFLWIATANGLARFDGKKFFNYSTRHGLPSNDVLQIGVDAKGTLWVNCYKQQPSFFNRRLNRFETIKNEEIDKICNHLLCLSFDDSGRAIFRGHLDMAVFDFNKDPFVESIREFNKVKQDNVNYRLRNTVIDPLRKTVQIEILNHKNETLASRNFDFAFRCVYWGALTNHMDVFIDQKLFYRFYFNKENQNLEILDSIVLPDTFKVFNLKNKVLSFVSLNGDIHIYDNHDLKHIQTLQTNLNVNVSYRDKNGNYWIGTMDRGLVLYTKSSVINPKLPNAFNTNLLSVNVENNEIILGNYQGQKISGTVEPEVIFNASNIFSFNKPFWIRAVLFFDRYEFLISDNIIANDEYVVNPIFHGRTTPISLKTAIKLNASYILLGSVTGLLIFNVKSKEYRFLDAPTERILSLARIDDHSFYFVASQGVYCYDLRTNKARLVFENAVLINERVDKIEVNKHGQLCFSTYVGKVYFLDENHEIQAVYGEEIGLPENLKELRDADGKVLWIATNSGVYGIDYQNFSKPKVSRFSVSDGLLSNEVNAIDYESNKLYVATNQGLSIIPLLGNNKRWPIYPKIVSIRIDGREVPIQSAYQLNSTETMANIQFSGVELYGHFLKFQYSVDQEFWDDMDGTILNLQLRPGKNTVSVRTVDDCNRVGEHKLSIQFHVRIPFYYRTWFWIAITFMVLFMFFYLRYRMKLEQQKVEFEKQLILRRQREKITADLHDEIGSTLSSLQINSAVSKKLISTDVEKSKALMNTIENQAKELSEKIGDIIWSMKPEDQFMSLSTRIKNFCSSLISPTGIKYEIDIDRNVDALLLDLNMRKNVLMICKEALNNAVKYSQAEHIKIILKLTENDILILVEDDGIGFDHRDNKGNGLTNMKRRTEELNGKLSMNSVRGEGTKISVQIPMY